MFWYYVFLIFHQKVFSFLFIVCLTLYFLLVSFFLSFGEFFSFFLITLIKIDGFFFNMCFGIIYFFNFPSKVFSFLFIAFVEFWFRLMIFFFFFVNRNLCLYQNIIYMAMNLNMPNFPLIIKSIFLFLWFYFNFG